MQNVKGTFDYFGPEQAVRKQVQTTLQEVFELYDFDSLDSTILNELELLTSKYAGGDEILKEMYQLTDQGRRKLGLRYDLTIPFAKIIALNPGIELPFRRYEIGKVFRDGPVKRGRLREFLQCDADVVGIAGPEAEAELMQLAVEVFGRLAVPVTLKWNNRRFLGELLEAIGVPADLKLTVMLTLDKIEKIGCANVRRELLDKGLPAEAASELITLVERDDPTFEAIAIQYGLRGAPGALEVIALQELIRTLGLDDICRFDPFLSRGLSFYTGTVYEIFDATGVFASSLGGGGRYDDIIGQLVGREDLRYPTVGLSFGMESIMELLGDRSRPAANPTAMIIPIGDTVGEVLRAASALRSQGIRIRVDMSKRKLRKSLASASSKGIRYVLLIGETEAAANNLLLKDMEEQTETVVGIDEAVALLKRER
ncbi:histidine--tRNA ligase [Paenibacillus sacheonensis]|uniref:Histidine--tRNA ligase n=1 Tax=Paenibacillus sacheonensis TaxID=742054 RepID=A0A7X4YL21_9BACL|nr:histidine--tRNA ligase [Paenibacillus sacheonensis]MBM7563096.1 histidyl-tRNA synthetase [Paenibacillus sacheonensis]NBC68336.1 histidine--tRNA ligase [Paenibacillus sacheonensis]